MKLQFIIHFILYFVHFAKDLAMYTLAFSELGFSSHMETLEVFF